MVEVRRMQVGIRVGIVMTIMLLIAAIFLPSAVSAETANTANTIKVSPVRTDIEIPAGQSKTVPMTVTNLTDDAIVVHAAQNDFISGDERGTPGLILDEKKYAPTHSLKRFMKPLSNVTIPAKGAKTIKVVISVPASAQAGGYYGAIRFSPANPDGGGQVNLAPSVASLILLTVPGDTVEKLELTNFDIQQDGRSNTYFVSSDKLQVSARFKSHGNVQVGPFGKISVKEGDNIIYEADFNAGSPRDVILPDSARRWDVPLEKIGDFGHYTVLATFTYGKENQTIEVSKSFWVIPQWMMIAAIVLLLVVIVAVVFVALRVRKRRHVNSRRHSHRRR